MQKFVKSKGPHAFIVRQVGRLARGTQRKREGKGQVQGKRSRLRQAQVQ